jgi:hypothetical protein
MVRNDGATRSCSAIGFPDIVIFAAQDLEYEPRRAFEA